MYPTSTKKQMWICDICGKPIETEDHVRIQTKRRSKLHIHNECMGKGMASNILSSYSLFFILSTIFLRKKTPSAFPPKAFLPLQPILQKELKAFPE